MKKIVANVLVISSQLLIGALFLVLLYSNNMEKSKVVVIENNNLNKTSDVVSNLFMNVNSSTPIEMAKKEDKKEVVVELKSSEVATPAPVVVEEPQPEVVAAPPVYQYTSLYTYMGMNLTGYGYDCYKCGGYTSTGHDARNIYYNDPEYGTVRVVAADSNIPFCTIVRISNIPNMDPVIAIVLDRGGDVGSNGSTFMDLLGPSEAQAIPKAYGVNIDILKYGDSEDKEGRNCQG